ncbi:MAG: flagellar basal body protein [Planctomycetota bacterium]
MNIGGANQSLLLDLMSAATLRARVLAGNIANQNTPGYKRREVSFEDKLVAAMRRPNPRLEGIRAEVRIDPDAIALANGNTVSLEEENSAGRQNRLVFELYASILAGQARLVGAAINMDR